MMDQQDKTLNKKKRNRLLGWISFGFLLLAIAAIGFIGIQGVLAYVNRDLGSLDFGQMMGFVQATAVFAGLSILTALVSFFIRKQKKGLSSFSMILALLVLLVSGGLVYGYNFVFGSMEHDKEFVELEQEQIHVVQPKEDGQIDFDEKPVVQEKTKEEVEAILSKQELEWEYLVDGDIPEEALPFMNQQSALHPCYLLPGAEQIENILLFGLDRGGASDSVMILSMDRIHKKIKLISLPRDSYIRIPEWGTYTKLAYAYSAGQAKMAVGAINYNYSLNIKNYMTVNFNDVSTVIDMAGGVDVELDYAELDYMNVYKHTGLHVGMNHLNGAEALTYSRMRNSGYGDNEIKRTGRQREVLTSLFNTVRTMPISSYPELIRSCMELCTTSLQSDRLITMLARAVSEGYSIETCALIDKLDYCGMQFGPRNYFYVVYDLDVAGDQLYRLIYEDYYESGYVAENN
ncbi:MAG: LCP family protein [Oscillospiraceae bacterium]|nr:LCP family protein [Oscillospiraceae bacterium]